jgi:hypothetical protein
MRKYLFFINLVFIASSCTDAYEQSFNSYQDFEKTNQRNKGWFPDIIDTSCSDIIGISSLKHGESFGRFNYKMNGKVDSILSNKATTQRINTNAFQIILVDIKTKKPDWFIAKDKVMGKTIWKYNNQYFAKDTLGHIVYFLSLIK